MQLADVQVHGLERVQERYVIEKLGLETGSVVDQRELSARINRLFSLAEFEARRVRAARRCSRGRRWTCSCARSPGGRNIVRFDVGLQMGTDSNTAFVIGGDYLRTWINPLGGEIHGSLYLGRTSTAELSLYQPLDHAADYFVEPGLTVAPLGGRPVPRWPGRRPLRLRTGLRIPRCRPGVREREQSFGRGSCPESSRRIATSRTPRFRMRRLRATAAGRRAWSTTRAIASTCPARAGSVG